MKTKLYKMWVEYCTSIGYVKMMNDGLDYAFPHTGIVYNPQPEKRLVGHVSFNFIRHNIKMTYPSSEYDAWRAFTLALNPKYIIDFLLLNYDVFKNDLPQTTIFLDLHQTTASQIYSALHKKQSISNDDIQMINNFKLALNSDLKSRRHPHSS